DVMQLHDVSTERRYEQVMRPGGALEALKKARDRGMCRFIGMTGHNTSVLLEAIETGEFDTVMCVYNLAIHEVGERLLPRCKELGVGVVIMKPLSGGIFFRLKTRRGNLKIPPEAAWRFVLSNPNVSVALARAKWLKDVHQAVRAARRWKPLTPKQADKYVALARSLGEDVCRDCRYCEDCPEGIPIPTIMQMIDEARAYPYEWPRYMRAYAGLEPKADVCTECGACERSCPFNLPIVERLKKVHERFARLE
ncbi:MAG: aldo/keto reductase, partial [Armatimonadota bacterium]